MKVSKAIYMLAKYHDMNEEIMIDWICKDSYEDISDEIWESACDDSDSCEYIADREMGQVLVNEAIINRKERIRQEEAMKAGEG
jgi:hypothetical protein